MPTRRSQLNVLLAAAAAFTTLFMIPASVDAETCGGAVDFVLPAQGNAPSNTNIWIGLEFGKENIDCDSLLLRGDEVVATSCSVIEAHHYGLRRVLVLDPVEDLVPGERYRVTSPGAELTSFVVEAVTDDEPPELPDASWTGQREGVTLSFTGVNDGSERLVLIDARDGEEFDVDAYAGTVTSAVAEFDGPAFIGASSCSGSSWPNGQAEAGATADLRYAAFDLAGNFSGWSEPERVTVAGGCSIGDRGPSAPLSLALLLLLVRRGSRRRSVKPARRDSA